MVDRRSDLYSIVQITIGLIHLGIALKIQNYFTDIISKISVVVLLTASFLTIYLIIRRFKEIRSYYPIDYSDIPKGMKPLGFSEYLGIKWRLFIHSAPEPFYINKFDKINDIEAYPLCPNCETSLTDSPKFFGGYVWKCVRCDFKVERDRSLYQAKKDVEKIVKDSERKSFIARERIRS